MELNVYAHKLKKIINTVKCDNSEISSVFTSKICPIHNSGMSVGDFFNDPQSGSRKIIDYIAGIEETGGEITALNNHIYYNILFALGEIWLSHILQPGRDIDSDSVWQVSEFTCINDDDCENILRNGYDSQKEHFLKKVFQDRYEEYLSFKKTFSTQQKTAFSYMKEKGFTDLGNVYPFVSIPYETLTGARGIKKFFYDCYTDIEKVKSIIDIIWQDRKKEYDLIINSFSNCDNYKGILVGCWRCAPTMINKKIFDHLVWPYIEDLGNMLISKNIVPIFHLDMCWNREIERFGQFPEGKIIVNIDGATDMVFTRKVLGDKYCLLGNMPCSLMMKGNEREIREYMKKLIDSIGAKGVFYGCGCEAAATTKTESFIAMYETINSYK